MLEWTCRYPSGRDTDTDCVMKNKEIRFAKKKHENTNEQKLASLFLFIMHFLTRINLQFYVNFNQPEVV